MKSSLSTLLERASSALPPQRPARSAWSPLTPVVRQLRLNGYDVMGAVDWLIGEGEIRAGDRGKAYRCLLALLKCHGNDTAPALTLAAKGVACSGGRKAAGAGTHTRNCQTKCVMPGQPLKKRGAALSDDASKLVAHARAKRPGGLQPSGAVRGTGDIRKRQRTGALQDAGASPARPMRRNRRAKPQAKIALPGKAAAAAAQARA